MKKWILCTSLVLSLTTALVSGCGGTQEDVKQPGQPGYIAPVIPPNGATNVQNRLPKIPNGYCDSFGGSYSCGTCPKGWREGPTDCYFDGSYPNNGGYPNGGGNCQTSGYTWNNNFNYCLPQGFGCPAGTTFDWYYGFCTSNQVVTYDPTYFYCSWKTTYSGQHKYVCGFIYGAPTYYTPQNTGYYWYYTGWGWRRW